MAKKDLEKYRYLLLALAVLWIVIFGLIVLSSGIIFKKGPLTSPFCNVFKSIEFMRSYQSYKVHVLSSFLTFNTVDGTPYLCPVSVLQM